ncbi:uncharacterized protein LOC100824863 [Brachypodium distachyon]|uniref:DUF3615 domain-containing protein n=1 Tax=Brachypodium distachyon TaxID=15368 RepID=I1J3L0_BRADI|nr:uncharacterized protein LOC100824863 [Brachypodium distachyon]XP_010240642.1 uncharacterized protein LOC100824863 [Brachypodium distachyon]XP_010240643.1 uncharacterized protein LOC100824863 [Brachypodium distachyon]XP_010240644.1 uncharacterized protein LOC100824863 [Brachypodium distachyon]XP_014750937.1 uncharacterized protein LOC100824863 [Brachypodium distachyon]KQJ85405.1 hypothetical protein BRADI_5g26835v3 [Brachypodium distachyon]|eukprot:XP_010240641.1 uncharacterized protein LOC100824863 [Brachypodium distachyon]
MGSFFSYLAGAKISPCSLRLPLTDAEVKTAALSYDAIMAIGVQGPSPLMQEELVAGYHWRLAREALEEYNYDNQDRPEFQYLIGKTAMEAKKGMQITVACVGLREHFWYHVSFSARRKGQDERRFFAELRYDPYFHELFVETCTILEEPLCRFRSSCAFCPDDSEILHPSETEFACGKEGHEKEFFRERDILRRPFLKRS